MTEQQYPSGYLANSARRRLLVISISLGFLALALGLIGLYVIVRDKRLLTVCLPLALATAAVPSCVLRGYNALRLWKQDVMVFASSAKCEVNVLFGEQFRTICSLPRIVVAGLVLVPPAIYAFVTVGLLEGASVHMAVLLVFFISTGGFAAGVGLRELLRVGMLAWHVGKLPIVVEGHRFGVMTTGRVLFKCYLMGIGIWAMFTISGLTFERLVTVMLYTSVPAFALILASFWLCQFPMHNRMLAYKRRAVRELYTLRTQILDQGLANLSAEQREQLTFYVARASEIDSLPEWPFSVGAFLGLTGTALVSLVPVIASKFLDV